MIDLDALLQDLRRAQGDFGDPSAERNRRDDPPIYITAQNVYVISDGDAARVFLSGLRSVESEAGPLLAG